MKVGNLNGNLSGRPDEQLTESQVREIAGYLVEQLRPHIDHADLAMVEIIAASTEPDALRAQNRMRAAQVNATLSLRDAVQEATATLRESIKAQIDSNAEVTAKLREIA